MEASDPNSAFVTTQETVFPLWGEISRNLERMAGSFGNCTKEDLAIYCWRVYPNEYMMTDERDPIIDEFGPIQGLPFVKKSRKNDSHVTVGWGFTLYQSRRDENIKYGIYTQKGQWGDDKFVICPKADTLKIWCLAREANKQANIILNPPILEEGLLEKIEKNTIGFLKKSKEIEKYGVRIKRGVILEGDPGNGKTMACRYIQKLCSQNGYDWGTITSSDIDNAYGDGELSSLLQAYTVSFFDDIDIQYLDRSKGNGKIACSLLTAMDGMSEKGHLVRIFTTNERVDSLDAAFTRPGRIDTMIKVDTPTTELRRKLVNERWPSEIKDNIDVENLISRSDKFSFAELEAIRSFLVTEKVVNEGNWDLDKAFTEFDERKTEIKSGVGFQHSSEPKPKAGLLGEEKPSKSSMKMVEKRKRVGGFQ
jgi:hypothetical protein